MKRRYLLLAFILLGVLNLYGNGVIEDGQHQTIAYVAPLEYKFWNDVLAGMEMEAERLGDCTLLSRNSALDPALQLKHVKELIEAGVDGIVISPVNAASTIDVLEYAEKAGVPVVVCEVGADSNKYISYVHSNNIDGASVIGKYLVYQLETKQITEGEIAIIGVVQRHQFGIDRTNGFLSALKGTNFKFVELVEMRQNAFEESEVIDLIKRHPDLVGIFTQHDTGNIAVADILEQDFPGSSIIQVGYDGSLSSLKLIKEGKLAAAAMQQPLEMGQQSLRLLAAYLSGQPVRKDVTIPIILVTRENVFEIEPQLLNEVFVNTENNQ